MAQAPSGSSSDNRKASKIDGWLRRLAADMPGAVKFRLLSSLEHFERAFQLLEIDREMASFRAITGEEEAASALIKALQIRGYPHSKEFNSRDHQHKAAVIACMMAVSSDVAPLLKEFNLVFDFERKRVDVKVPLSNFNIAGGENFAVQPVEPLDIVRSSEDPSEVKPFDQALANLALRSNYESIKRMISQQANGRNTLLYASDSVLPASRATSDSNANRERTGLILLVLSAMVLQSRKHQSLVCQAIDAFLGVISRLPTAGTRKDNLGREGAAKID
jgi:hypothetical protein